MKQQGTYALKGFALVSASAKGTICRCAGCGTAKSCFKYDAWNARKKPEGVRL
jgi:hypothetical protein